MRPAATTLKYIIVDDDDLLPDLEAIELIQEALDEGVDKVLDLINKALSHLELQVSLDIGASARSQIVLEITEL